MVVPPVPVMSRVLGFLGGLALGILAGAGAITAGMALASAVGRDYDDWTFATVAVVLVSALGLLPARFAPRWRFVGYGWALGPLLLLGVIVGWSLVLLDALGG